MMVGQVERKDFGRQALQEQNYSRLLSDVTKSVIEVIDPDQASEAIARAFHLAESGTPGPVAVILPEDIFDEKTDAAVDQPRPRVLSGARARIWIGWPRCWRSRSDRWCWWAARCSAIRFMSEAVFGDLRRLAEEWVLPISPDASPAPVVRRDASALRRIHGHPRATCADQRDEKSRSYGGDRRTADRQCQPVIQLPCCAAAATAAGPCVAGCQRSGARLASRSRHCRRSI